jgi:hypothetical protein
MITVLVLNWVSSILGRDDTIAQKDFSAGSVKGTFLYILKDDDVGHNQEDEMTNFV